MSDTLMPKTYDFAATEQRLYNWWWQNGWFKPEAARDQSAESFVISIPPPNVTGELHWGHAMFVSVEDLMIRYARMQGKRALWVPGMDHAGIATQLQVEKLLRAEGTTKDELGREEFVRRVWQWKDKYGGIIQNQIRRLGASADWDRERFTLDEGLSRAVREAFVRLYEQGAIYRGTRLVNWSPGLKTAVSDIEVEYSEEQVTLYTFKYFIKGQDGYLPVATIRPETILGDTAVAVHPDDERFNWLIGQTAIVPILNREIPVIGDAAVDREFGGGALKITPGHDPIDYEIAQRHNLPIINLLTLDAKINDNGGPYQGLDRFAARDQLWADMEAAGLTIKTEPYTTNIPHAQRGGEIIEPLMSTQWYVKIEPLAEKAYRAVASGQIKIIPERFEKVYYNWMDPEHIKDWCISRQLWWGHRIPVWTCETCQHEWAARVDPAECPRCGGARLRQDPDVLDTWFSSGLWPFSTLGWPEQTPDLKAFYPTRVMETGYDILFFWVARMIMLGLEMTDEAPFHTVYLHGLVRDEHGRKMSKSLGNAIDPIALLDEFGTDAFRFTLLTAGSPGNDLNLGVSRIESNRNFANKIWNMARFVISNLGDQPTTDYQLPITGYSLPDRWILSRLNATIASVTRLLDDYQFGEAGRAAYDFLWGEYADWYIELSKIALNSGDAALRARTQAVLVHVLDGTLRLLHPFIPFVTEEIWQNLKQAANRSDWGEALIMAEWPRAGQADPQAETDMALLMDAIRAIRNARAERNVEAGKKLAVTIVAAEKAALFEQQRAALSFLARIDADASRIVDHLDALPPGALPIVLGAATIYLPLSQLIDVAAERVRLTKEQQDITAQIERLTKLLSSDFANKAPAPVVQKERDKLVEYQGRAEKLREQIERLG